MILQHLPELVPTMLAPGQPCQTFFILLKLAAIQPAHRRPSTADLSHLSMQAVQSLSAAAWLWALQALIPKGAPAPTANAATGQHPSGTLIADALPAVELGCWTFCANAATVIGFEQVITHLG